MTAIGMKKVFLEYKRFPCSNIGKEVTITSMVIEESDQGETPDLRVKQAFDCSQKEACGVLSVLGKERRVDWAGCTHPNLVEVSEIGGG